ncbi:MULTISPECIES: hypothetical protein [Streptomyces]|uniref:hypothetical protein n=1 Tax=Streptomyces TaxID=1883 RepID=UPI001FD18EA6|nr:hypothetical protein [Streptomyces kasugaensis]
MALARLAVAFNADTGRLDIVPDAPACGTKLRWGAPKLIAAANEAVPGANVRALHVLAPAPMKTGPATAAPQPTTPAAPVQRRTPPDGYRRAIEAHRQAAPPSRVGPAIARAMGRQNAAMRGLGLRAFPEPEDALGDASAPTEAARAERRRQAAATADSPWLFPGGQPGRPISVWAMGDRLRKLGIRLAETRSTALFQLATELPAAVLARTLGIDITVAVKWQRAAAGDWGAYAAEISRRASNHQQGEDVRDSR